MGVGDWRLAGGIGFVLQNGFSALWLLCWGGDAEIGFVFSLVRCTLVHRNPRFFIVGFLVWAVMCCPGLFIGAAPPLMHEAACFVRKIFVFWVEGCCKCCLGKVLKFFVGCGFSRIVQTGFVSLSARGRKGKEKIKVSERRPRNPTYIGTRYL